MEDNIYVNKISENEEDLAKLEFKYNFITTPWDDRSNRSKFGIVLLLIAIFLAIMACVINNFVMFFKGYETTHNGNINEINCFRVRNDDYRYVARIYSLKSKQLLCLGALLSPTSVLANGLCAKSGPIRIYFGSLSDPYCRKGFSIDGARSIHHDGAVSKELVLLSSYEDKKHCAEVIDIGDELKSDSRVYIIGRSTDFIKSLSQHYVSFANISLKSVSKLGLASKKLNGKNMICVRDLTNCPVKVGDLLLQNNLLFGLAATSTHGTENNFACFSKLKTIRGSLKRLDSKINI